MLVSRQAGRHTHRGAHGAHCPKLVNRIHYASSAWQAANVFALLSVALQERVSQCLEAIQAAGALPAGAVPAPPKTEGRSGGGGGGRASSSVSVPRSPTGVLDAGCLSYRSEDTTVASSSQARSFCDENDSSPAVCSKRRKISR